MPLFRSLLAIVSILLLFPACDTATEEPPQASQLIHGTYSASWQVNEPGPGDNLRTETLHNLSVSMTETNGTVTQFPGNAGTVQITRSQVNVNTGDVTNRVIRTVAVRVVSGRVDRTARTFDLRIEGDLEGFGFEATYEGSFAPSTYNQLIGEMNGRLFDIEFPDSPSSTLVIDQTVTLEKR